MSALPAPRRRAPALLLALSAALSPAAAPVPAVADGVSCHCFRDRDYDPADPGRTDEYLLATAANTLLASAYGYPKGRIVRERMSGVPAADLWIAAYAGARLGPGPDALRAARTAAPSWRDAIRKVGGPLESLAPRFLGALGGGAGDEAVALAAAGATVVERLGTPPGEVEGLAARGATLQETVLASLLGIWTGRPPTGVLEEVRGGRVTWSAVLNRTGLVPTDLERKIPETLGTRLP